MLISFSSATSSGSIHLVWAGGCRQIVSCMIRQRGLECVGGVSTCAGVGAGGGGGFCPGVLQGLSRERVVVLSGARLAGEVRRAVKACGSRKPPQRCARVRLGGSHTEPDPPSFRRGSHDSGFPLGGGVPRASSAHPAL